MPAEVVTTFDLPKRTLPAKEGDVLVLSDGPSLGEYDLSNLKEKDITVCGYGRSALLHHPDHYWATDHVFFEVLTKIAPTKVYACPDVYDRREQAPHHEWFNTHWFRCSFNVQIEARRMFPGRRIFVLGVDGYHNPSLMPRHRNYSVAYPTTADTRKRDSKGVSQDTPDVLSQMYYILKMCLYIQNFHKGETWLLGYDSFYSGVYPTWPGIYEERYGRLDRAGPAVILDCIERPPTKTILGKPMAVDDCYLQTMLPQQMLNYVHQTRHVCPYLPIFVRLPVEFHYLSEQLPDDVQVGGPDTQMVENHGFCRAEQVWLPFVSNELRVHDWVYRNPIEYGEGFPEGGTKPTPPADFVPYQTQRIERQPCDAFVSSTTPVSTPPAPQESS